MHQLSTVSVMTGITANTESVAPAVVPTLLDGILDTVMHANVEQICFTWTG